MKLQLSALLTSAMFGAGALSSAPVQAAAIQSANATAFCQSALPVFDTNIRKRPLAVRNEGVADAFVSCSLPAQPENPNETIVAYFVNRTESAQTIRCTFVEGLVAELETPGYPRYYQKNVSAQPGVLSRIEWDAASYGSHRFYSGVASLSCNLPPGTEIAFVSAAELD